MIAPRRIPLYLAALATAGCAPQQDMEADIAAVRAVREQEVAVITSGQVSTDYLAADAVLMPPNGPAVSGADAIEAWMSDFMAQFSVSVDYTTSDITVSGDWAIEHYAGTSTVTPAGGGDAMEEGIKGIHAYRREPDGSWKMVYDVWNSDTPLPEM